MEQKNKSKNLILGALDQAAGGVTRFKKSQLEEIFDELAEFRARGLSRKQITVVLSRQGLEMSEGVYASTMARIKKERQEKNEVTATEKKIVVVAERKQTSNNEADKEKSKQQKHTATKPPVFSTPAGATASGTNPLRVLSGKPKAGDHNPIPTAKFEVDNT